MQGFKVILKIGIVRVCTMHVYIHRYTDKTEISRMFAERNGDRLAVKFYAEVGI